MNEQLLKSIPLPELTTVSVLIKTIKDSCGAGIISKKEIYNAITQGKMKGYKKGNRYLVFRADFISYFTQEYLNNKAEEVDFAEIEKYFSK